MNLAAAPTGATAPTAAPKSDPHGKYPMQVQSVGEDTYIVITRGHHDVHEFMREVRNHYTWPLGMPQHTWMKTRPSKNPNFNCFYDVVPQGTRGAWPATHVQEAWGEDSYESLVKAAAAAQRPRERQGA